MGDSPPLYLIPRWRHSPLFRLLFARPSSKPLLADSASPKFHHVKFHGFGEISNARSGPRRKIGQISCRKFYHVYCYGFRKI